MTTMFCCDICNYQSIRKFNLQKHIKNIHKSDEIDKSLNENTQITTEPTQITTEPTQITTKPTQITTISTQITTENTQITTENENRFCEACQKVFKTPHGFRNHQKICKGVVNSLECHHCHKVFTKQQSKSRHIKICKLKNGKELALQALQNLPLTNNITNNTQTNNTQTNNQTNIYIQSYRQPYQRRESYNYKNEDVRNINDFGCENRTYITDELMKQLALACNIKRLIDLVHFNELHPENHNIRINDNHSYAVLKDRKWHLETKDDIHHNMYRNSQTNINDYRYEYMMKPEISEEEREFMIDETIKLDQPEKKKNTYKYIGVKIKETTDHYSKTMDSLETNVNPTPMITI
jgi:hypothetical protein